MDDMYNKGRNQHTIPGVLRNPSEKAVQSQPISYETTPLSEDHIQSPIMSEDHAQSSRIYAQDSFGIPGGAETFIKARPSAPPVQPSKSLSQPASSSVPLKAISQRLRADPSYQVLAIAVVAVLIASSVLAAFLATGSLGAIAHHTTTNQPLAKAQATATARSTQGHTTTIPKPAPTQGSTQANPPATQQPTQSPSNPGGTPPPNSGGDPPLATQTTSGTIPIQFVNLPQQISFNASGVYNLTVQTQPNLYVYLGDYYASVPEGPFNAGQAQADERGIATFGWNQLTPSQPTSVVLIESVQDENGNMGKVQVTISVVVTQ